MGEAVRERKAGAKDWMFKAPAWDPPPPVMAQQ